MNFMEKLTIEQNTVLSDFIGASGRTTEEVKRAQAILLVSSGASRSTIKLLTGLERTTAVKARKKYLKLGIVALEGKRKDKKPRARLTATERAEIGVMLNTETPKN